MMFEVCPFCGLHPYEYVDVGVGMVPVAVNCCPEGQAHFEFGMSVRRIKFELYKRRVTYQIGKLFDALKESADDQNIPD
jgi:hypothetical protein